MAAMPRLTSGRNLPPEFPGPRVVHWTSLRDIALLRRGEGTALYTGMHEGCSVVIKTPAVGLSFKVIQDVVRDLIVFFILSHAFLTSRVTSHVP